jgi:ribosomal protein L6P/L9E
VQVGEDSHRWVIQGPLGSTGFILPRDVQLEIRSGKYRLFGFPVHKCIVLASYARVCNALKGVCLGFSEMLQLHGVGWQVEYESVCHTVVFALGCSHKLYFPLPQGVEVLYAVQQQLKIFSLEKDLLHRVVSAMCRLSPTNVYTGKGVCRMRCVRVLKVSSKVKSS